MRIFIKYIDEDLEKIGGLQQIDKGNFIDVRACRVVKNGELISWEEREDIVYNPGDDLKIYLGFAMELPKNCEALVVPRGSTFKNYGIIQVNSPGVVDTSFCGDEDEWFVPFYALRRGRIRKLDRVAQFRVLESMGNLEIHEVEFLGNKNRGSYGSTGVK